jgi:hypothetical protein
MIHRPQQHHRDPDLPVGGRDAAYRRLALTILGLDVATLASALRSTPRPAVPRAA